MLTQQQGSLSGSPSLTLEASAVMGAWPPEAQTQNADPAALRGAAWTGCWCRLCQDPWPKGSLHTCLSFCVSQLAGPLGRAIWETQFHLPSRGRAGWLATRGWSGCSESWPPAPTVVPSTGHSTATRIVPMTERLTGSARLSPEQRPDSPRPGQSQPCLEVLKPSIKIHC